MQDLTGLGHVEQQKLAARLDCGLAPPVCASTDSTLSMSSESGRIANSKDENETLFVSSSSENQTSYRLPYLAIARDITVMLPEHLLPVEETMRS